MSSDKAKLGSLLTFTNGKTSPARRDGGPIPVYGSNGVIGYADQSNSPPSTIVIGRVGTYCGSVQFSKKACWVTDNAIKATAKAENDPFFLYCLLANLNLNNWRSGSGQPLINQSILSSIEVAVPSPEEQKQIGRIAAAIDDRITLLDETNATLEAIAQALFKSWFVDFDPVRAKQEGREPEGLDAETAALFPSTLHNVDRQTTPEGWIWKPAGEIVQVVDYVANGSFAALKENVTLLNQPGYALYVRTTDFNSGFNGEFRFVDEAAYRFLSKSSLTANEVIISNVGDVGTVFRPPAWLGYPMTLGSNAIALKAEAMAAYLFFYFRSDRGQDAIQSIVTGSAQMKFNKTNFRALKLLVPAYDVLQKFENVVSAILQKHDANLGQMKTLTRLRDALLPRLIAGQLRLPEAEEQFGDALTGT